MFFAIVFIAIGLAILLNTLGFMNATFWGLFWGIFFLAVGFRMIMKKGKCPMCGWGMWKGKDCCDDECCSHEEKQVK